MKKLMSLIALCALPFSANAIIVDSSIAAYEVDHTYFSIDADSNVRLETLNAEFDPVMYLFRDDGFLDASDLIAVNDDGGTPAASFYNSLINAYLSAGSYVVAVGDYHLSTDEAISGVNSDTYTMSGNYQLLIEAESANVSVDVPEPSTLALLGLGLLGFVAGRKRLV